MTAAEKAIGALRKCVETDPRAMMMLQPHPHDEALDEARVALAALDAQPAGPSVEEVARVLERTCPSCGAVVP